MDALTDPARHFDTSGKSAALLHDHPICKNCHGLPHGRHIGLITGQKSRQLKLQWLATAKDRRRVAEPCALCDARAQGDIDMDTVTDLNKATAKAQPVA